MRFSSELTLEPDPAPIKVRSCTIAEGFPTWEGGEAHLLLPVVTYRSCATAASASVAASAAFMARTGFECNRKNRSAA